MGVTERRSRERQQRRRSILDAAEHVFARNGFESPTMEDIAASAEVGKGTLYLYFDGKDALFSAIAERGITEVLERVEAGLGETTSGIEGLRSLLETAAGFFEERQDLLRFVIRSIASVRVDPESKAFAGYREKVGSMVGMVVGLIERGKRDGTIRADVEPAIQAVQLWGSFLGVWMLRMNREEIARRVPRPVDLDALVPTFIETNLRAIGAAS